MVQSSRELRTLLADIYPRLAFHASVGLNGLRRSFVEGFAAAWDSVRQRSINYLSSNYFETISSVERSVKQLLFTATSEMINRKLLYFSADNQLSAKLEIAIQALDNVTKVSDSYMTWHSKLT